MHIDMKGKTALVTGGATGIGKGIALALADCGVEVAVTYFEHGEQAEATAREIAAAGVQAHSLRLDVTDAAKVEEVISQLADLLGGRIDILVNNAGTMMGRRAFAEITPEFWRQVIALNLDSAFYVTRAALPYLSRNGGRIIYLSSLAGRNGGGKHAVAYAAAKAGVLGLTRGLAKELGPQGITVNALAPGLILGTAFHENYTPAEAIPGIIAGIPLARAGRPEDVAGAVVYLASNLGAWITGEVMEINGGAWVV